MEKTKFVAEIISNLEVIAWNAGIPKLRTTQEELFTYLDVFFALVEADTRRALDEIKSIEDHYTDYCDCGDWDELHNEVLLNDKYVADLSILKMLGTPNYADDDHKTQSTIVLLEAITYQLKAKQTDEEGLFDQYYYDRLVDCLAEVLDRKEA